MKLWTYAEARDKVQRDLDLQQETFVTPDEMLGYFNAAIDEAEAEIHTLYEDYFLSKASIDTVADQADYDLPTDIYANKIRGMLYNKNNLIYTIRRMPEMFKFHEIAWDNYYNGTENTLRYIIYNPTAWEAGKFKLIPTPKENRTGAIELWYLRNANRVEADTDVIDIPEFVQFVMQFVKVRCYEKEGNPNMEFALGVLAQQRKQMQDTLSNMIPDSDNLVEQDRSAYADSMALEDYDGCY